MRQNRSATKITKENDPPKGISITTHAREYAAGSVVSAHAHGSDQLIYASRGVMEVSSGKSVWTIPPHFGLWIPARTEHQIKMPQMVSMRTLYLRPELTNFGPVCTVLYVDPLFRELVFEIVRLGKLRNRNRLESALRDVLIAQIKRASPIPTVITMPADRRAIAVAQSVLANPAARKSLSSLCASAGISVRTLERIFSKEVGLYFESWRRQVRLMKGIELLISGCSVKEAAFSVGYLQPSAFVSLFRTTFGTTPKAWLSALNKL